MALRRLTAPAKIKNGKLFINARRRFDDRIELFKDGPVHVTVERAYATRSPAQNDYYWSVVVARIAAKWKKDADTVHELLKAQFLPHEMADGRNGTLIKGLVIGGSTTLLNKLEFIEYLERIVWWSAEKWHVYIPDPSPTWREDAQKAVA